MKINEIFYSLQGEGFWTGTPAVFIRLSGCNLKCDFCDTDHSVHRDMTADEIAREAARFGAPCAIITGGEPTLQLDTALPAALHRAGMRVHIETNGSIALSPEVLDSLDWVTCSPKEGCMPRIGRIDELKVVFDRQNISALEAYSQVAVTNPNACFLQPCDRPDLPGYNAANLHDCIAYILCNPAWRLSLQTHKLLGFR